MKFIPTPLAGAVVIELTAFRDERGFFTRTFCADSFRKNGLRTDFAQSNHSRTKGVGTLRGMHYQLPPHGEVKVVRCTRGAILDVFVDIRAGSPTFLQWFAVELSEDNLKVAYIPDGFAHGFQALTDDVDVMYNVSAAYAPNAEGKIHCQDPRLNIPWPKPIVGLSPKDAAAPFLSNDFQGV
jgi:dTDP-4-dehydrorhamnose 3,5-epimerase